MVDGWQCSVDSESPSQFRVRTHRFRFVIVMIVRARGRKLVVNLTLLQRLLRLVLALATRDARRTIRGPKQVGCLTQLRRQKAARLYKLGTNWCELRIRMLDVGLGD